MWIGDQHRRKYGSILPKAAVIGRAEHLDSHKKRTPTMVFIICGGSILMGSYFVRQAQLKIYLSIPSSVLQGESLPSV
ncbi:hypothetical protein ASE33_28705 [Pseudomonas sp. Root9]|nr:hypothetical protein ASE33_28705 [Pseudomonas sp. Root9]